MTPLFTAYLIGYVLACVLAIFLMIRERDKLVLFRPEYWQFLKSGWKLGTFAVAALAMTIVAPYTGDPTWDSVASSGLRCRS